MKAQYWLQFCWASQILHTTFPAANHSGPWQQLLDDAAGGSPTDTPGLEPDKGHLRFVSRAESAVRAAWDDWDFWGFARLSSFKKKITKYCKRQRHCTT